MGKVSEDNRKRYYYKVQAYSYDDYEPSSLSKWKSGKVNKPKTTSKSSSKSTGQTVYITETGDKYHSSGCRYLRKSCYSISLSSAKSSGYTACSVCM